MSPFLSTDSTTDLAKMFGVTRFSYINEYRIGQNGPEVEIFI